MGVNEDWMPLAPITDKEKQIALLAEISASLVKIADKLAKIESHLYIMTHYPR